ncbi:MAG: glycosyltransferase [Cytophagaceae bacterium]|nr:glycosyltransferase [Cytophagaceae bacterium]MDW8456579.1 glycosyltransferase [Cytophagaceae bacterium]
MKKKILIASVLKPVNDTRKYEKIGISLVRNLDCHVHIAGHYIHDFDWNKQGFTFHPIYKFSRISIGRVFAGLKFLLLLVKLKPDLIICETVELLFPSCIYKIFSKTKLLYDIRENYFRNFLYTNTFPPIARHALALYVRSLEWCTQPVVNGYILAEKIYKEQCVFVKNKYIILENKPRGELLKPYLKRPSSLKNKDSIKLIYSGTISEHYGIFEAVQLAESLNSLDRRFKLTIVGFSAKKNTLSKLLHIIKGKVFIQLIGGDKLVSHEKILFELSQADIGLISYRPNKSTEGRIPTKLYEYIALKLPYIINYDPMWEKITHLYQSGLIINYASYDGSSLINSIFENSFYSNTDLPPSYWEDEEHKLIHFARKYLKN